MKKKKTNEEIAIDLFDAYCFAIHEAIEVHDVKLYDVVFGAEFFGINKIPSDSMLDTPYYEFVFAKRSMEPVGRTVVKIIASKRNRSSKPWAKVINVEHPGEV